VRLFVALAPPAAALDHLDAACASYRPSWGGLRWTSRGQWHVTLAFLGEVSAQALARLEPELERAARRHRAPGLSLAGAGAFPGPARANVLWSGLSGDRDGLGELAQSVSAGARQAGAPPPDTRRYRPHLTLARCREPADLRDLVAGLSGYQGPAWTAGEVHLVGSIPGAQPPYESIASWSLGPAPVTPTTG
jgi:2'-5' RNA ligase